MRDYSLEIKYNRMAEEPVHRMKHIRFQHYYQHFVCRTTVILLMGKCNVYCGMCYVPCAMILLAKMYKYEIINVKCNIKFASNNYLDHEITSSSMEDNICSIFPLLNFLFPRIRSDDCFVSINILKYLRYLMQTIHCL